MKIHLHRAYKKLGIANRSSLAVMVSSGVLPTSDGADPTTRRGRLGIETYPEIGRPEDAEADSRLLHMQVHNVAAGDRLKDLMDD